MDLIFTGFVIGVFVIASGLLVNWFDPAKREDAPALERGGAEADALPSAEPPELPAAGTGIVEGGAGPYRKPSAGAITEAYLRLTDEQKLAKLMIASCCRQLDRDAQTWLREVALSLSVDVLIVGLERDVSSKTVAFALKLRNLPDDRRALRNLLASGSYSRRRNAAEVLELAYGHGETNGLLASLVSDEAAPLEARREAAEHLSRNQDGQKLLKTMLRWP